MTEKLEVPFKLYVVYEGFRSVPEIQSVTVVRITAQYWWFERSGDLGFACRVRCEPGMFHRTKKDAVLAFRRDAYESMREAERTYKRACKLQW